jgi:hypothetical protein
MTKKKPEPSDQLESMDLWARDALARFPHRVERQFLWIGHVLMLARMFQTPKELGWAERSMFWILLHAVVTETVKTTRGLHNLYQQTKSTEEGRLRVLPESQPPLEREAEHWLSQQHVRACAVRDALTEGERVVVWSFRNQMCHFDFTSDGLRLQPDFSLNENNRAIGYTVAQIDAFILEHAKIHGDEPTAARHIAFKVTPALAALYEAFAKMRPPPA